MKAALESLFGPAGLIAFAWVLSVYGPRLEMKLRESRSSWRFWSMRGEKQQKIINWIIGSAFFLFLFALDAVRRALF